MNRRVILPAIFFIGLFLGFSTCYIVKPARYTIVKGPYSIPYRIDRWTGDATLYVKTKIVKAEKNFQNDPSLFEKMSSRFTKQNSDQGDDEPPDGYEEPK